MCNIIPEVNCSEKEFCTTAKPCLLKSTKKACAALSGGKCAGTHLKCTKLPVDCRAKEGCNGKMPCLKNGTNKCEPSNKGHCHPD